MISTISKMAPTSRSQSPVPQLRTSTVLLHRLNLSCTREPTSNPHRSFMKTTPKHPLNYPREPTSSCSLGPIISLPHNCSRGLIALKHSPILSVHPPMHRHVEVRGTTPSVVQHIDKRLSLDISSLVHIWRGIGCYQHMTVKADQIQW
ncbi:hypothetical protein EYF80_004139 [Liparis tanakae]|uniref:Uncharacterized protein n=1 Tax=Liparis tanakae TaxID=230148 RepID=A0A4Z2J5N7_9TELE|nr:hypothetical protein EYF80_004139 [Liparis tanakae]